MDFELSKEHLMARGLFRDFARREVLPLARELDENERFPKENIEKLATVGMFGIPYAKKYGGQGAGYLTYALAIEEISAVCASTGIIISAHTSLCGGVLNNSANEQQKLKYLVPLSKGEKLGAFALTEANAGSDVGGVETKAVLEGDEYILNGNKIFITNASVADIYAIFAMTDKEKGTRGLSCFIVEKGTPGFSFGKPEKTMGIKASVTCELIFENVKIPKENLVGKEGQGFSIAMKAIDAGRIGVGAQALGIAQGALNESVKYVKERKQFGKTLASFQNTQFTIADMEVRTQAARCLVYRAACAYDRGEPYSILAAQAKLFASETASWVANKAVQLHGGYGYMRDYNVERMVRDAKTTEIYEGTSEIMRMVISGALLR